MLVQLNGVAPAIAEIAEEATVAHKGASPREGAVTPISDVTIALKTERHELERVNRVTLSLARFLLGVIKSLLT